MANPLRGRRAAPTSTTTATAPTSLVLGAAQRVTVLADGEYTGEITGARLVTGKSSGATSLVMTFRTDDGQTVALQPMLLHSQGGPSTLTETNVAIARDLAGIDGDDPIAADALVARLTGARVWLDLSEQVNRTDGRPINRVEDGGTANGVE
jgi:hypothetical protein